MVVVIDEVMHITFCQTPDLTKTVDRLAGEVDEHDAMIFFPQKVAKLFFLSISLLLKVEESQR